MTPRRKYEKGMPFASFGDFGEWVADGGHVYWHDRFTHNGWALSWQIRMVVNAIPNGVLSRAVPRGARP